MHAPPTQAARLDRLLVAARDGDAAAADELLRAVIPPLRVSIAARAPRMDLVEEVLQDTLLICLDRWHDYRCEGTFLAWLRGIARNVLLKRLRQVPAGSDALEGLLAERALERTAAQAAEEAAEDHLVEVRTRVQRCLHRLSPRARTLLLRRHGEGLPLGRLAQQFKQPATTLASTLKRLRRQVRHCMQEPGGG